MTIPFKPSLLAMASILALSACISGGGGTPVVKSSETPSNKVTPPADTVSPATGADTAGTASGGDGRESKTEIPPKDTQGEGETAQAGADGGVQNDAPQHVETSTESTPPSSTSEGTSSFRRAGEYRATARRVARSVNEPEGTINISYNYDGMPDIHGFFADPRENNTVTVTNSTTEDKVKELVKAKIQAKANELAKHGYKVKEEIVFEQDTDVKNFNYVVTFTKETTGFRNDNAPATGTPETQPENNRDMPVSAAGGADGGNQDVEKVAKSQDGTEGKAVSETPEDKAVSEDAGMQASPPSEETGHGHNDNAPAADTSGKQPENNRMPGNAAGGTDGGNQDTDAPKNAESLDGTEGNAVSEGTGMPANPPSENAEHTEVATNTEGANPPSEAENSDEAGQGGMQADDGRQDAEGGLQGDDPAAHSPKNQDQQPQNAADNQPKTGVFGEKYFDGTGEITALMISGETIDLTKADEPVSRNNHPGLMSDFDKVMVSQGQYQHLIYGAAKLEDGTYTLFVQGKPTEQLPVGNATYNGKVLHFRKAYENNWFNDRAYQAAGTFTANVDFSRKAVTGKIDTKDFSGMGMQEFTARIDGNGFQGKWKSDNDQGNISGKFYGQDGAEMAGRYDYKNQDNRKDGFGVFAGKKEADAR